ncbi:MAG: hypothetical protein JW861_04160 [Bacteroidales bacterium]|nr:hypothetical protein [Bacteroidales bacterium]
MTESIQKSTAPPVKQRNRNNQLIVIALLLLLVVVVLLVWLLTMRGRYRDMIADKEFQRMELQKELDELMVSHDSIKILYGTLADSLFAKDSIIQANAREIQQLLNYKWEYYKVEKKLDRLREITQGYVHQIDSLFTVNRVLREENEQIRQQYSDEQARSRQLIREMEVLEEQVSTAAILKAYNVTAEGIRQTGSGRERTTDKASKIEQVKVCFTISENTLVTPGPKIIYMRIARPDNQIVAQKMGDVYTFDYQGEKLEFTSKKEIEYQNQTLNLCMYWSKKSKEESAMVGKYTVTLYAEGALIGEASFELR